MTISMHDQSESDARTAILQSIREHLAESPQRDAVTEEARAPQSSGKGFSIGPEAAVSENGYKNNVFQSPVEMFREHLAAVGGHCLIVRGEVEVLRALNDIIAELQTKPLPARCIALSDAPLLARLMRGVEVELEELTIAPSAADLFSYDIGITTAQAAIAETGTLMLNSDSERHRLVSLLPPVHIAVVNSEDILPTLSDALEHVRGDGQSPISRTITLITGPSRTADIELTLAIGVHGPKELYVIVNEGPPLTTNSDVSEARP